MNNKIHDKEEKEVSEVAEETTEESCTEVQVNEEDLDAMSGDMNEPAEEVQDEEVSAKVATGEEETAEPVDEAEAVEEPTIKEGVKTPEKKTPGKEEKRKKKEEIKNKAWKLLDVVCNVLFVLLLALLILLKTNIIGLYTISGSSMQPTMRSGERTLTYSLSDLRHGDIVYVDLTDTEYKFRIVKRVIGLPGDTLTFTQSNIKRNGVILEEKYILETPNYIDFIKNCDYGESGSNSVTITLGEDEYFVMGDNRNHSNDSRDSKIGPISKDRILGKYVATLYYKQPLEIEFTIEDFETMD